MLCYVWVYVFDMDITKTTTLDEPDALLKVSVAQVLIFITCPLEAFPNEINGTLKLSQYTNTQRYYSKTQNPFLYTLLNK